MQAKISLSMPFGIKINCPDAYCISFLILFRLIRLSVLIEEPFLVAVNNVFLPILPAKFRLESRRLR